MNEKKPCPLSREEWLDLLKTYLSMKKSEYYHNFNTTLSFVILIFAVFIPIIIAVLHSISMLIISYLVMAVAVGFDFIKMKPLMKRNREESNAIYGLIKKIINGDPVESDKIRGEWDMIEKEYQNIIMMKSKII